jgi:hypothetical protein
MPTSISQARFAAPCSIADTPATADWTSLLPEYLPSLPALARPAAGPSDDEQAMGSVQVLQGFVDSDPGTVTQQMWEIADTLRLDASHGVDLSRQHRRSGAKLLFHHQPYAQQVWCVWGGGVEGGVGLLALAYCRCCIARPKALSAGLPPESRLLPVSVCRGSTGGSAPNTASPPHLAAGAADDGRAGDCVCGGRGLWPRSSKRAG